MGPSFFLGDLGGTQGPGKAFVADVNLPLTKIAKGIFFTVYPAEWVGLRVALNHSYLEGDDNIINPKGYYFPDLTDLSKKILVELKPLKLEGQGMTEYPSSKEYSLWQPEIPLGVGFKYYFKENAFVGLEVLYRKTFTDYMDDVSIDYIDPAFFSNYLSAANVPIANQLHNREPLKGLVRPYIGTIRGNPKENDAYFSFLLRFCWRLNWNNGFSSSIKNQVACPKF